MSKELTKTDYTSLPATTISQSELQEISKVNEYLSRIQLYTKGRAIDTGAIAPGHYGVPQTGTDEIIDLGDEIDLLVFAMRAKAMDVSDAENITVSYDLHDETYKNIVELADSGETGCLYGPSFLVYERSTNAFYEMFFCNKSARKIGPTLFPYLPLNATVAAENGVKPHGPIPVTLGVRYAKNKKGSWHVSTVRDCKAPFTKEPAVEQVIAQVTKFLKPEDTEEDTRGRDR